MWRSPLRLLYFTDINCIIESLCLSLVVGALLLLLPLASFCLKSEDYWDTWNYSLFASSLQSIISCISIQFARWQHDCGRSLLSTIVLFAVANFGGMWTLPSWASILHYVKQTLHWQLSPFQDVLRPWWSCINNHFLVFYVYNCIISRNFCVLVSGIIYYYHRSVSWLQSRRTEARYRLQFSGLYLRIAVDYSISLSVSVIAPSFFCSNKWI